MQPGFFFDCSVNIKTGRFDTPKRKNHAGNKSKETGYMTINLKRIGQQEYNSYYVHRAVWSEANQREIPPNFTVHHIDGDKENNSIYNLSLVSQRLNCWFAAQGRDYKALVAKRRKQGFKAQVVATCLQDNTEMEFPSMNQCAKHFHKNVGQISRMISGAKYHTCVHFNDKTYTFRRKSSPE